MTTPPAPHASPSRQIGWRRIAVPSTWAAVVLAAVTALATTAASVIAGRLAEHTSARLVTLLAVTVLGGALVDTAGRFLWAGMVDRAAGQLRRDLVDAVLAQPLEALSEQAGGEILDRVDDDTHEISNLLRQQIWMVLRMTLAMVPMWIVAGITWWPAWVLFPLFAALTWVLMRSLLAPIAAGKVLEEAAWTEHAAIFEEGVAGRDDIRTSLGQPFVVARLAKLSASVVSELQNVLVGLNVFDRDIARAADLLGFPARDADLLRNLAPGDFFAMGPALSATPVLAHIDPTITEHLGKTPELRAAASVDADEAAKLLDLAGLAEVV